MKNRQILRLFIQLMCILLTIAGSLLNLQATVVVIMAITIFGGAYYCGWICPYGAIQDIFNKLGNTLGIKQRKMPKAIQKYIVYLRYAIAIVVFLSASDLIFEILSFDPRTNILTFFMGNVLGIGATVVVVSFSLIALFFERPFCNYMCIEGAKYGIISSLRIFTISRNTQSCVNCKKCDKACPMNIEVSSATQLHSPQCINCFECTDSCPIPETLTYSKRIISPIHKRYYMTGIVTLMLGITAVWLFSSISSENLAASASTQTTKVQAIDTVETQKSVSDNDVSSTNIDSNTETAKTEVANIEVANTEVANIEVANTDVANTEVALTDAEIVALGDFSGIQDGVYSGIGYGFRGAITVEVTFENDVITKVEVVENREDRRWFNRANNSIPDSIVDAQSADVNIVSGATFSSRGIIDGARAAIEAALQSK